MSSFDYIQCEEYYAPSGFARFVAPDPDQESIDQDMARQRYIEDIRTAEQEM